MKIYLVTAISWGDSKVTAVFTSRGAADSAMPEIKKKNPNDDTFEIDEWEEGEIR